MPGVAWFCSSPCTGMPSNLGRAATAMVCCCAVMVNLSYLPSAAGLHPACQTCWSPLWTRSLRLYPTHLPRPPPAAQALSCRPPCRCSAGVRLSRGPDRVLNDQALSSVQSFTLGPTPPMRAASWATGMCANLQKCQSVTGTVVKNPAWAWCRRHSDG